MEQLIKDYFSKHKLSPTGIVNFLHGRSEVRNWINEQIKIHSEYLTVGNYIICLVKGITLPKCLKCGKTLTYKQYRNKRPYCSKKCFFEDINRVQRHIQETMMKKYGVKNCGELKNIQEKRKATIKEKYGVEFILQNKYFVEKAKDTMMKKYGVDSYLKTNEHKQKYFKKVYDSFERWKDYVIPLFSLEEYHGSKKKQVYKWKCVKCGNEFEQYIHSFSVGGFYKIPRCLNCYPYISNASNMEKEILDFIKSIYIDEIVENDRSVIPPYELDIYLPGKKIGIEYDGLFWHNDKSGKDSNYHLIKTELCEKQGIQLIHIFEDEWIYKKEIVKDRIKSLLGIDRIRIYARKCEIREIDSKISNEFLELNHLQGKDNSSIRYGLYYENELISVMTFGKPRFNKNYDYELIRFCSKIGFQVIGGASKLLKHFQKNHKGSIISYADRRYSMGKLYETIGFKKIRNVKPNYYWTKNQIKFSRYQCQKHKLSDILKNDFNPNLSETENMRLNGYDKIYDCGNLVYTKEA